MPTLHHQAIRRTALCLAGQSILTSAALQTAHPISPRTARRIITDLLRERAIRPVRLSYTGLAGRPARVYGLEE